MPWGRAPRRRPAPVPAVVSVPQESDLDLDSTIICGTSGLNVLDAQADSGKATRNNVLDTLEMMLRSRHMAPSSKTSTSVLTSNSDPFVLRTCPHIFFTASREGFCQRILDESGVRCLLISVPFFSQTQHAVLVNLRTLQCTTLDFTRFALALGDE